VLEYGGEGRRAIEKGHSSRSEVARVTGQG
jgi:hypothetical protein